MFSSALVFLFFFFLFQVTSIVKTTTTTTIVNYRFRLDAREMRNVKKVGCYRYYYFFFPLSKMRLSKHRKHLLHPLFYFILCVCVWTHTKKNEDKNQKLYNCIFVSYKLKLRPRRVINLINKQGKKHEIRSFKFDVPFRYRICVLILTNVQASKYVSLFIEMWNECSHELVHSSER